MKNRKENMSPAEVLKNRRSSALLFSPPRSRLSDSNGVATPPALLLAPADSTSDKRKPEMHFQENDDMEELKSRQRQRVQQNASTPTDRAKQAAKTLTGLSHGALAEHYSNCIKLSAENKINMKNAFNLQLIDCMTEMMQKNIPEMSNFQAVSCTLDASAKIYAYRVDAVHTETLKIAGGLGRSTKDARQEGDEEAPEGTAHGRKKTKKSRTRKTIETNLNNIDMPKSSMNVETDPYFKKACSLFDHGRSGGIHFLASTPFLDDSCELNLDRDRSWLGNPRKEIPSADDLLGCIPPMPDISKLDICPSLKHFSFRNTSQSLEDGDFRRLSGRHRDANRTIVPVNEDYVFDVNALPTEEEARFARDDGDDFHYDGVDDIDDSGECAAAPATVTFDPVPVIRSGSNDVLDIVALKEQLSLVPGDYSYFKETSKCAWAGPTHWKFPSLKKVNTTGEVKTAIRKKKSNVAELDFEKDVDTAPFFKDGRKISRLGSAVKWSADKVTLPVDANVDIEIFTKLKMRPLIVVGRVIQPAAASQDGASSGEQQEQPAAPLFDYNNFDDMEPCATGQANDDSDDERFQAGFTMFGGGGFDMTELPTQLDVTRPLAAFGGDNLVDAPDMVSKVHINYARVAKKMDMKRLKYTLWKCIKEAENDTATDEILRRTEPVSFSEIYDELPKRLPAKMSQNLSVSLAFIGILHLANENNLSIYQKPDDLSDFTIKQ